MNNQKIVLFDIDYTLFDTASYLERVYKANSQFIGKDEFLQILDDMRKEHIISPEDPSLISKQADINKKKVLVSIWNEVKKQDNFYEETIDVVKKMSKIATVGIFSKGFKPFQQAKIESLAEFFNIEHIHITFNKDASLPELLSKYKKLQIVLIDDSLNVLYSAKKLNKGIYTVLVKRKIYPLIKQEIENFKPDLEVTTLKDTLPLIEKL